MEYTQEVNTLSDKEYLNFINSPKSPATKKQYAYLLSTYMKFLNIKDPAQLLFHITKEVEQHLIVSIYNNNSYINWQRSVAEELFTRWNGRYPVNLFRI